MILKKAIKKNNFKRNFIKTNSARDAWSKIIEEYKITNPKGKIILPAYIGWSPNEGSGIFDSVLKSGLKFDFYDLSSHLDINFEDLKQKTIKDKSQLVLLVHYFGFVDSKYDKITKWLSEKNIFFVEDCAHAWLTDLIGGICGRKGAFSFYSLHKLLPLNTGGIMVNNNPEENSKPQITPFFELNYDLFSIYSIRRSNYNYLVNLLNKINGIEVIYKKLEDGICPQTLPVIVEDYDRTKLYHQMNDKGYGMVSLYHTMIKQLDNSSSQSANTLSKKIINFPIHQDITQIDLDNLVIELKILLHV